MGVDALMGITTQQTLSSDLIRETSWKLCAAFGPEWFFVKPGQRAIEICLGRAYDPPLVAPANAYSIGIWNRYAPLDYIDRQHCLDGYAEIAWWLEHEIPGCRVWYGNDVDCVLHPFGPRERAMTYHHQLRLGHHIRPIPPTDGRCFCTFCKHHLEIRYNSRGFRLERCLGCTGSVLFKGDEVFPVMREQKSLPKALHELTLNCVFDAAMIIY